jgi:hypothetical protein
MVFQLMCRLLLTANILGVQLKVKTFINGLQSSCTVSTMRLVLSSHNRLKGLSHEMDKWTKVDWLAACIALRVVGAVLVVFRRRWRKICTILQPMGSKVRYLKKSTKAC